MGAIQKPSEYVYRHKSLRKNRNERFGVYFLFFGRYRETLQYKKEPRKKKRKKGYPQLISRVSFFIPSHPSHLVSRLVPFSARPVLRPSRSPSCSVLRPAPFPALFRSPPCSVLRPPRFPSAPFSVRPVFRPVPIFPEPLRFLFAAVPARVIFSCNL